MAGISAWRANDVVAYDLMRESATTLMALLSQSAASGLGAERSRAEIAQLRREVLSVDGFSRDAVATLAVQIETRMRSFSEVPR